MSAVKRALAVGGTLLIILGVLVRINVDSDVNGVTVRLNPRSIINRPGNEKKLNKDASMNLNCLYILSAFDRTGRLQSAPLSNGCLESNADLLDHLVSLASAAVAHPNATAAVAISVIDRENYRRLESLGLVADEFLTPRMDWRIMAERFNIEGESSKPDSDDSENNTVSDNMRKANSAEQSLSRLLWDPAAYAPGENGTFADPFISAIRTLRDTTSGRTLLWSENRNKNAETATGRSSDLNDISTHVDLILLRVLDEKLAAFAGALRRFQFPDDASEDSDLAWDQGRTMVKYGGPSDFLGAWTVTSANSLAASIRMGFPFIRVSPVQWARTYHFDTCSAESVAAVDPALGIVNGLDCGFLPIYGGTCLHDRVDPALKCMSQFAMGSLMHVVLPRDGIPEEVCQSSREQSPQYTESNSHSPPAKPFVDWCPQCLAFGSKDLRTLTPELLANSTLPMGFAEIDMKKIRMMNMTRMPTCTMELTGLNECGNDGRPCCWDEVSIPQDVLGSHDGSAKKIPRSFYSSMLTSYLVRFNRSSRQRIARLYHPRLSAMIARGVGWANALATGKCATLHIRRGDNMDRCKHDGPESQWCSMNLTLADYMEKATPMLAQLGGARHVFVMTDDAEVVKEDKLSPWLKDGYFIEVISGHNQYSQETYSDWDPFIESLHGAQFCRAFVGHHISTVSKLVFKSICTRWGECPITDDFSGRSGVVWG